MGTATIWQYKVQCVSYPKFTFWVMVNTARLNGMSIENWLIKLKARRRSQKNSSYGGRMEVSAEARRSVT